MERKYRYLGYIMLLLFPLTFFGFYKTYFQHFPVFSQKVDWFAHGHALVAALWLSLLIIQPILVVRKKYVAHRTIGKLSYFVFGLLILSFVPQITKVVRSGDYKNLFFPLGDTFLLITFYALAIVNKRNIAKHMRYMIAAALVFLGPTIGRMGPLLFGWSELLTQNIQYSIIYAVLVGLLFYDRKSPRRNTAYVVAIGMFFLHQMTFNYLFT